MGLGLRGEAGAGCCDVRGGRVTPGVGSAQVCCLGRGYFLVWEVGSDPRGSGIFLYMVEGSLLPLSCRSNFCCSRWNSLEVFCKVCFTSPATSLLLEGFRVTEEVRRLFSKVLLLLLGPLPEDVASEVAAVLVLASLSLKFNNQA